MNEDMKKIADAYKKIYGDRWRIMFAKYHWCVYVGAKQDRLMLESSK